MLLLEGSLKLTAGELKKHKQDFIDFVKACNEEAGCLEFSFSVNLADSDLLNIRERFVDEAAFEAHQQAEHTIAFKKQLYEIGVVERDMRFYLNVDPVQR